MNKNEWRTNKDSNKSNKNYQKFHAWNILIEQKKDNCPELVGSLDKVKQSLDKNESNDLVLCTVSETVHIATKQSKKSVRFLDSIKEHDFEILLSICETGMMWTIDGELFFIITKNMWIEDLSASCHITNNDTGVYNNIDIDEPFQVSSGNMKAAKRESYIWRWIKLIVVKLIPPYVLLHIVRKHCSFWHANSHEEQRCVLIAWKI